MREVDLAWAAGIIDGEGCIRVNRSRVVVQVGNTDPRMLLRLRDVAQAGTIRPRKASGNRRPQYLWSIASREADTFLSEVEPFLVVKGEEARLALEFSALVGKFHKTTVCRDCEGVMPESWVRARGLCQRCYWRHRRVGTLGEFERLGGRRLEDGTLEERQRLAQAIANLKKSRPSLEGIT